MMGGGPSHPGAVGVGVGVGVSTQHSAHASTLNTGNGGAPGFTGSPGLMGHHVGHHVSQQQDLSSAHAHASLLTSGGVIAPSVADFHHDTERRSSSIAALRLKAREHTVAAMGMHGMGILSVYGAK